MQPNTFLEVNANKAKYVCHNTYIIKCLCMQFQDKKSCAHKRQRVGYFQFSANDCCLMGRGKRMLLIYHNKTMKISFNRFKNYIQQPPLPLAPDAPIFFFFFFFLCSLPPYLPSSFCQLLSHTPIPVLLGQWKRSSLLSRRQYPPVNWLVGGCLFRDVTSTLSLPGAPSAPGLFPKHALAVAAG